MAQFHSADAGYFAAIRAPIVRGRTFDTHDDAAATPVVIVNETLAKRLWPNEDPIGKRISTTIRNIGPLAKRIVPGNEHQVVGIVRDIRNTSLRDAAGAGNVLRNWAVPRAKDAPRRPRPRPTPLSSRRSSGKRFAASIRPCRSATSSR